jgi:DNA-binding beta-propeller fold protein YncE
MKTNKLAGLFALLIGCIPAFSQTVTTISPAMAASGGISIDKMGNILVADYGDALPNANGTAIRMINTEGILSVYATGFQGASGNTFAPDGNLYQCNIAANSVSLVSGSVSVSTFVSNGLASPVGIISDTAGNLFVANCGNNTVQKISPTGISTQFASSSLFQCPNGITIDEDQNLYVSNFNDGNVLKITPTGSISVFANIPGGNNGHITYSPAHDAFFVASHGASSIFRITKNGKVHTLAGAGWRGNLDGPAANATFSRPNGIAVTKTGDTLYVNSSVPTTNVGLPLNPSVLRMITGVNLFTANENLFSEENVAVYPNPTSGSVFVRLESAGSGEIKMELFGPVGEKAILGRQHYLQPGLNQLAFQIPKDIAPGIYILKLKGENISFQKRIMVRN